MSAVCISVLACVITAQMPFVEAAASCHLILCVVSRDWPYIELCYRLPVHGAEDYD